MPDRGHDEGTNASELYRIYGNIGNLQVTSIRKVCRDRVFPDNPFVVSQYMRHGADEARENAETVRRLDGSDGAESKLKEIMNVHLFMAENPREVISIIKSEYDKEWSDGGDYSTAEYSPRTECYYEQNPTNRSCWGCSVPSHVYGRFLSMYKEENNDMGSMNQDIRKHG